jgi:murein DD-endopeptidase MepM/ murein hydrolase activator NlpD
MKMFPVAAAPGVPVSYVDTWGAERSEGRAHEGTDIFAPRGTPVVAVDDGEARLESGERSGLAVALYADQGQRKYIFAHLDSVEGRYPREVSAGELLGAVGDSGNARGTDPHLHFEVRTSGEPENPFPHLNQVRGKNALAPVSVVSPVRETSNKTARAGAGGVMVLLLLWFLSEGSNGRS